MPNITTNHAIIASLVLGSLRYNTVQYSLILQSLITLPPSCIGDYTVKQCNKPLSSCIELFAWSIETNRRAVVKI